MRTIRVTGKGRIKLHPDMTKIVITLCGRFKDYGETLKRSAEDTESLKDLLIPFGFERTSLKTLDFFIDTEYESYEEKKVYKRRFAGYSYRHIMKIEFMSDNSLLGKVLYALANSELNPEFRISYTVSDPEAAKTKLLGKAVKDAKDKAFVLTESAGTKLKDIQSIDYSWGEVDFEFRPMSNDVKFCIASDTDGSYSMDIEPDDIDVSDTVTVIWEIE